MNALHVCLALTTAAAAGLSSPASAEVASWNTPAGGSFQDPGNWLGPVAPPGPADTAVFDIDATYTVAFEADAETNDLRVRNGDVTFDLGGSDYSLNGTLLVGTLGAAAELTIVDGTLRAEGLDSFGDGPTSVRVGGGLASPALLRIGEGGTLHSEVFQTSEGSSFEIVSGGQLLSDVVEFAEIQPDFTSAVIDGAGSLLAVSKLLRIGVDGFVDFSVTNGGRVVSFEAAITEGGASSGDSQARIVGPGSTWLNARDLTVGRSSYGRLSIEDGGLVETANLFSGRWGWESLSQNQQYSAASIVDVTGVGSLLRVSDGLALGGDFGEPDAQSSLGELIGPGATAHMTVADHGQVTIGKRLALWNGSSLTVAGGSVDVGSRAHAALPGELRVHSTGTLMGAGTVHGLVSLAGILDPGGATGDPGIDDRIALVEDLPAARLFAIDGDLVAEESATLTFDVTGGAGSVVGESYDAVAVTGETLLAGILSVSVLNEALGEITATEVFTILVAEGGLTGAFANVASGGTLVTQGGNASFQVFYGVGSPFAEDEVVLTNFAAVPEPASLALVSLGLGALALRRRRPA